MYWGTEDIVDLINPEKFITVDLKQPRATLERIKTAMEDPEPYLKAPVFTGRQDRSLWSVQRISNRLKQLRI